MNKLKFVLPVVALCFIVNGCGEAKASNTKSRKLSYPDSIGLICNGHPEYLSHGHYNFYCDDGRIVYNIQNAIVW